MCRTKYSIQNAHLCLWLQKIFLTLFYNFFISYNLIIPYFCVHILEFFLLCVMYMHHILQTLYSLLLLLLLYILISKISIFYIMQIILEIFPWVVSSIKLPFPITIFILYSALFSFWVTLTHDQLKSFLEEGYYTILSLVTYRF